MKNQLIKEKDENKNIEKNLLMKPPFVAEEQNKSGLQWQKNLLYKRIFRTRCFQKFYEIHLLIRKKYENNSYKIAIAVYKENLTLVFSFTSLS